MDFERKKSFFHGYGSFYNFYLFVILYKYFYSIYFGTVENVKLFQFIYMIYFTSASFLLYCGSTFHPLFSFFLFFGLRFLSQ